MKYAFNAGRISYGMGLIAYGALQVYYKDFRPSILPPAWPAWMHGNFPVYLFGALMIAAGVFIIGIIPSSLVTLKKLLLSVAAFFLACFICFHLPFIFFKNPVSPIHLFVWVVELKALAFSGGAMVLASAITKDRNSAFLFLVGRILFSLVIILFGVSHFYYLDFVAPLVPKGFGMPLFWTKFAGVALIASGCCIILNLARKVVALLQAGMIFIWVIVLHIPRAIESPALGNGNEVVSAFDALLFTGVALVIAYSGFAIDKTSKK